MVAREPQFMDNGIQEPVYIHRISWTGIATGLVAGLVIQAALMVLGLAIGLVSVNSLQNLGGIAITAGIWLAISWAIAAYVSGLTAARAASHLTPGQGRFNGLITGMLLLLVSTLFTASLLSSAVDRVTGAAKDVAVTTASAVGGVTAAAGGAVAQNGGLQGTLQSLGLGDAYQTLSNGLGDTEINQIIADASPELNQTQVAAATGVIRGIINNASRDLGTALQNPSELGNFVSSRVDSISKALSGPDFVNRLQRRGLSKAQAQEVSTAVNKRVSELRTQGEQAAKAVADQTAQLARSAADTAGKAAWTWLLFAGLVLGFASLGGGMGNDLVQRDALKTKTDPQSDSYNMNRGA
jgi:hypothetical protein